MQTLVALAPSLQLFAPVLVAVSLFMVVLGRRVAARNCSVAVRASEKWTPSIASPASFPINRVDTHPRMNLTEPSDIPLELSDLVFEDEVRPFDSASATLRFVRA